MGLKVGKLRKKVFRVNKRINNVQFVDYDKVVLYARKGDILEIKCGKQTQFAFVEKVNSHEEVWCFYAQKISNDKLSYGCLGIVRHKKLLDIVSDMRRSLPETIARFRVNNQNELSHQILELTQNSTPNTSDVIDMLMYCTDSYVNYDEKICNCQHYATLWRYGIGWSSASSSAKNIIKTILKFKSSFSEKCVFGITDSLTDQCFVYSGVSVIIYCYGLYDKKLIDAMTYIMQELRVIKC